MEIKEIPSHLLQQLLEIQPSRDYGMEYRPCQVVMEDGKILDRVYVTEAKPYLQSWGVMPDEDEGKKYILIEKVKEIKESPFRMPVLLANKLYEAGESGMGYCLYKLKLDNGQILDVATGNAVDFPPLPEGMTKDNIQEVFPLQGSRTNFLKSPDYIWCLFKTDLDELTEIKAEDSTNEISNLDIGIWSKLKNLFLK